MHIDLKSIGRHRLLYVMATTQEYGERLKALIKPLITGVGPVEAATVTTRALTGLAERRMLPTMVVSLGSAGSRMLEQTKVYQARSVSYRDMDASAFGFEKGVTPFLDLPAILPLQTPISGIPTATLSTGGNIVSGPAYDAIEAEMVDMETYSVLRACSLFNLPLVALRGISDGRDDVDHIDVWTRYLHIVDQNLADAVFRLEGSLQTQAPETVRHN
ncbi:MAG: 5'-methylthioadenosine/S-adenosylhomocysteine nucleosidase [Hyphomicrobiaceae bacterium]|nr:5'-methylthioadenosine/S-adenosylhomocysteine nucleosidase [Hyphomicrobiaceae bacterium]